MSPSLRKSIAGSLAALALAGGIAVTSVPASAEHGRHAAAGFGFLGGLAAGAIIGGALSGPGYPDPGYGPGPGYEGPEPGCGYSQQPVYDQWGQFAGYQAIPNC